MSNTLLDSVSWAGATPRIRIGSRSCAGRVSRCAGGGRGWGEPPNDAKAVVDLSLLVAPDMPCTWPAAGFPPFHIDHYLTIGPLSPYNNDILAIDGNTGTQLDVPPHSIPHPDTNLPNAGPYGRMYTDKVPAWQFCGEACVVDCRDLLESETAGRSALVKKERIIAWEREHRPLGPGDVVVLRSGYTDKFYRPLPAGRRFAADPVEGLAPAWPDPDPATSRVETSARTALAKSVRRVGQAAEGAKCPPEEFAKFYPPLLDWIRPR